MCVCACVKPTHLQLVGHRRRKRDEDHLERGHPEAQLVRVHRPAVLLQGVLLVDRRDGRREARQHVQNGVIPFCVRACACAIQYAGGAYAGAKASRRRRKKNVSKKRVKYSDMPTTTVSLERLFHRLDERK